LTITALYFWPWEWFLNIENGKGEEGDGDDSDDDGADADETLASSSRLLRYTWPGLDGDIFTIMFLTSALSSLRKCLLLAALACVLRPTNVIIWACLAGFAMYHGSRAMGLILLREATLCG
jgi:phosphatidylinositol glycan class B